MRIPIFSTTVTLMWGGDWEVWEAEKYWAEKIVKAKWDGEEGDKRKLWGAHFHLEGGTDCALWFHKERPSLATVSHEVFHAVANILRKTGVTFSKDSEEVYAYFNDWLVTEVGKHFWWNNKTKKKKKKRGPRAKKTS